MSEHIVPVRIYLLVFGALVMGTILTYWTATEFDLGAGNIVVALSIALTKALLVILYFMHVRYSSHLVWVFVAAGFFWLAIMISLTMGDILTREWLGRIEGWPSPLSVFLGL